MRQALRFVAGFGMVVGAVGAVGQALFGQLLDSQVGSMESQQPVMRLFLMSICGAVHALLAVAGGILWCLTTLAFPLPPVVVAAPAVVSDTPAKPAM